MNIEQIDKWLNEEYGCSYTRLEELHNYFFEKYTDQKEEIERLNKEVEKYKKRCFKGLKLIRDNYGVLDKYGVDMLDDILNGVDKE